MKRPLARSLAELIDRARPTLGAGLGVRRIAGPRKLTGFHEFADKKPVVAAFEIHRGKDSTIYVLLIDWYERGDYYCVLFPKNRSGPLAEISQLDERADVPTLTWPYKPTKHDGKNPQRREYFRKHFRDTRVGITIPANPTNVAAFLEALFDLVDHRLAADELSRSEPHYREAFPEGDAYEAMHLARERNQALVRLVKDRALRSTGRLSCQVCAFDFARVYGDVGRGFIEAHHTRPLSMLKKAGMTKPEEMALVCSNCHRMLHYRRPWLRMGQLKKILVKRRAG